MLCQVNELCLFFDAYPVLMQMHDTAPFIQGRVEAQQ
ncbi:hypothetical protein TRM7615_04158 [Falsiruegeria mediterranea M17]|uniref:Uncharacterized protein n=1 Tax=Falsiruegeria mediterranea M17 TaxID=1200281 RepID=A0A2R8CDV1_9RHOB|nr:hypothetical protein TRM7615_04158 [Falsiruegeria mediterranea M17]